MKSIPIKMTGRIIDGTNNSNTWMPLYLPKLYPGTLNVLLDNYRPDIQWHTIYNLEEGKYADKFIFIGNCLINNQPALIVKPPAFKYRKRYNWLEIGHYEKLRDKLKLSNNDVVEISFVQGDEPII